VVQFDDARHGRWRQLWEMADMVKVLEDWEAEAA